MKRFFKDGMWGKDETEEDKLKYYDSMTGLGNLELLKKTYQRAEKLSDDVLVIIQLNRFNNMNALFGMETTGKAVRKLAGKLSSYAREQGGIAYKLRPDILAVMAPFNDKDTFMDGLKYQLKEMEEIYFENAQIVYRHHYTFTYVTCFLFSDPEYIPEIEKVIDNMMLMLENISQGIETVGVIYNEKGKTDWRLLESLRDDVERGWAEREFIPYFQLIYEVKTGRTIGAEMLARWQHPQKGLLYPGDFLAILESKGLIMELDLYMLEEACKKIRHWLDEELLTVPITVNISKLNLHRAEFSSKILQLVQKYDIPPVLIILELEENIVLYEMDDFFIGELNELKDYGFNISMDRFAATEYSSINMLRNVPVDMVKLSPHFFPGPDAQRREKIFVRGVLRLVRELGIKAVGELVESKEDVERLEKYGCECAQGFYYSKPLCNSEFEKIIF